ncbi:MAG: 16S rRNA (guanine(966)-N(2))-methyltransferase RsmD [Blastocatellia bacterium]|nr:16S rRNA (guanine(966)-N(2))-methyltransferase RsmD [Blastocatellia bacterium]
MRVIAGKHKGRTLRTVAGIDVRPTSDRLRETIFNILAPRIENARFLDICAGSGAMTIEAISRGALEVALIESSRKALKVIYENLNSCKIDAAVEILSTDALVGLKRLNTKGSVFDIVYFDPPYKSQIYLPVLEFLANSALLASAAIVMVEHYSKSELPEVIGRMQHYRLVKQGETSVSFYSV